MISVLSECCCEFDNPPVPTKQKIRTIGAGFEAFVCASDLSFVGFINYDGDIEGGSLICDNHPFSFSGCYRYVSNWLFDFYNDGTNSGWYFVGNSLGSLYDSSTNLINCDGYPAVSFPEGFLNA